MNKFVIGKLAYKYSYYTNIYIFDEAKQGRRNITLGKLTQNMNHGLAALYEQNLFMV